MLWPPGYLHALAGSPRQPFIYTIGADGSLTPQPALAGVPAAASGLVAR